MHTPPVRECVGNDRDRYSVLYLPPPSPVLQSNNNFSLKKPTTFLRGYKLNGFFFFFFKSYYLYTIESRRRHTHARVTITLYRTLSRHDSSSLVN